MLSYYVTYELAISQEAPRLPGVPVLFVTTSMKGVLNMIEVNRPFNSGAGSELFLFMHEPSLYVATDIVNRVWINGRGERVALIKNGASTTQSLNVKNQGLG